ncbi:DNA repair protein RecN [Anaerobiospirillum sp. NML120448]|uniref:DNA repair protein RecN n=1 Tax=Anaerobiospirillum sp. NML120448 TaxID=2932816 RepID=UPI001FF4964B|nr:DNA repair protein RecN [Anaerobiospirillum sp. NML120448]MCK0513756.1 DNA repair protein RecN [Anaerobiospirillum sp. NML120448]
MLEQLKLNNLALSVQAEVDFTAGMICITGETGAGKSLVVDALGLVLGAKADANMVRQGEKQLEVSGLFSIKDNPKVNELLQEYGFTDERFEQDSAAHAHNYNGNTQYQSPIESIDSSYDYSQVDTGVVADGQAVGMENYTHEEQDLVLRRIVTCDGKSKAYINGHMATLTQLRELGEYLVAIHGQHASVKLMDEKHQLEIVDNYGKLKPLVNEVNQAFNNYSSLRQELFRISDLQKQGASTYKQDRYDLEELNRLAFQEGDYEELEAMFDRAMNQAQFSYILANFRNVVEGGDSNVISILRERLMELDKVKAFDPNISKIMENIEAAILHLDEGSNLADDLSNQTLQMSTTELEGKMSKAHELARRFSCLPKELYLMSDRIERKVNEFLGLKDTINKLTQEVKSARNLYEEQAKKLSEARVEVARDLALKIAQKITSLAMPDARFDITIHRDEECRPRLNGRDELCFMFSANLGQDLRPLAAVASGGELSRLALTIEVLTASVKSTPTLIFDEVDTGISGRTASAVGSLLHELGQYVQVITVTHLPQVAAKAHSQFVVSKSNEQGGVNSTIAMLNNEGRVEEISRMIGGSIITETTRKSAYELLHDI